MNVKSAQTWRLLALLAAGLLAAALPLAWADARSRLLAFNTLRLALSTAALALPLGGMLGVLIARADLPGRRIAAAVLLPMLFVPLYMQAGGWLAGFGPQGWHTLGYLGLGDQPWLAGWRGAVWVHAMAATPWTALIVAVGLRLAPREIEEAALLEASPPAVFLWVTLPRAAAALGVAALWIFVLTAGEITVTDLFLVRTYAEEVYLGFALGDTLAEAPLGVLPGMTIIAWLAVTTMALAAAVVPGDYQAALRPPLRYRLGRWRWPAAALAWLTVAAVAAVPAVNLAVRAGVKIERVGDAWVRSWSAGKLLRVAAESPWFFRAEIGWSLAIGAAAATAALAVAIPLAWAARRGGWRAAPAALVAAASLAVPGPILGLAVVRLLNQPALPPLVWLYDETILAPLLTQVVRCLPLVLLIVWQALRTVAPASLEVAALDGAGPLTQLLLVALPQRGTAIAAAWLVGLAVAAGELSATASDMVLPPGIDPLSRRVFGLLHAGEEDPVWGICLVGMAAMILAALAVAMFPRGNPPPRSAG